MITKDTTVVNDTDVDRGIPNTSWGLIKEWTRIMCRVSCKMRGHLPRKPTCANVKCPAHCLADITRLIMKVKASMRSRPGLQEDV